MVPPIMRFEPVIARFDQAHQGITMYRAKIPGGWLVGRQDLGLLTFVSDPEHAWDGNSLP